MPYSPRSPRRRTALHLRLLLLGLAIVVPLAVVELLLQAMPRLLPTWFRTQFPPNGIEFLQPGVLDRTAITAVPLPFPADPYSGPPPHDLVDHGVAPAAAAAADLAQVPNIVLPVDTEGMPNPSTLPAQAPVVLIGDSFCVYGSQQEPAGLLATLTSQLGVGVRNVSVSGIGPDQELFLLEHVALPCQPRLVVWMFFGGNDFVDAFWSQVHRAQGVRTLADLYQGRRVPTLYLPTLLARLFTASPAKAVTTPLPPFTLTSDPTRPVWFFPDTLRAMSLPAKDVAENPGWFGITTALRAAKARCATSGARLLVVYLPSKEQVYLPRVDADAPRLQRFALASSLLGVPLPPTADEVQSQLLANRAVLEGLLTEFCRTEELAFWSATPTIEAVADQGIPAYYTTDTHWRAESQRAVAKALAEHVVARNLLPR